MSDLNWKAILDQLKISSEQRAEFENKGLKLGQITYQEKGHFIVHIGWSEAIRAKPRGRLTYEAQAVELPCVGDWVWVTQFNQGLEFIEAIAPRKSTLVRKAAGEGLQAQVMASNVTHVLILSSLNQELNHNRIERYVTLAFESGAKPIIVLTKADLLLNEIVKLELANQVRNRFAGISVLIHGLSSTDDIENFRSGLELSNLIVLLGSSGVGKSTLTNFLVEEDIQKTQDIRESDSKGRHTTTARHLIYCQAGFGVIDTPGMRELSLHQNEEGLTQNFKDIEELSLQCKFSNCSHLNEKDCAVRTAIKNLLLTQERFDHYLKLKTEGQILSSKKNSVQAKDAKTRSRKDRVNQNNRLRSKNKY